MSVNNDNFDNKLLLLNNNIEKKYNKEMYNKLDDNSNCEAFKHLIYGSKNSNQTNISTVDTANAYSNDNLISLSNTNKSLNTLNNNNDINYKESLE